MMADKTEQEQEVREALEQEKAGRQGLGQALQTVRDSLDRAAQYEHAVRIINYDQETICPSKGMGEQAGVQAFLANQAFRLKKEERFTAAARTLYQQRQQLDPLDRLLAQALHREDLKNRRISPEKDLELTRIYNQAFVDWLQAKKQADFSLFEDSLRKVREADLQRLALRDYDGEKPAAPYDALLDDYERGMTEQILDGAFQKFLKRMTPLLREIQTKGRIIRTDFLSRPVTDQQQREMADWPLDLIGFDKERGAWTTTEHPFTDNIGRDDARVTTHFYPRAFLSSMFSIIHEGGHALFMQQQPQEDYDHHINDMQSMGQHESVSRFYENRIGRSQAFISLIYPRCVEIFPQVFTGVTMEDFYRAVNVVQPSLIRTEADEFTYTFHIIIRYELEKAIVDGGLAVDADLPRQWNALYQKYLGVCPANDREGILQDVHWASGFGYFPAYALGNMYNAMYYNRMAQDLDLEDLIAGGRFDVINGWMAGHVFARASRLAPGDWIKDITGRSFTADDFLDYLEEKYTKLYLD